MRQMLTSVVFNWGGGTRLPGGR